MRKICSDNRDQLCFPMPIVAVASYERFFGNGSLNGVVFHAHPWRAAAHCVGSFVALQFLYVAVSLTLDLARFRSLIPDAQKLIGRRLSVELEVPPSRLNCLLSSGNFRPLKGKSPAEALSG
jgi:hypothetical protein